MSEPKTPDDDAQPSNNRRLPPDLNGRQEGSPERGTTKCRNYEKLARRTKPEPDSCHQQHLRATTKHAVNNPLPIALTLKPPWMERPPLMASTPYVQPGRWISIQTKNNEGGCLKGLDQRRYEKVGADYLFYLFRNEYPQAPISAVYQNKCFYYATQSKCTGPSLFEEECPECFCLQPSLWRTEARESQNGLVTCSSVVVRSTEAEDRRQRFWGTPGS